MPRGCNLDLLCDIYSNETLCVSIRVVLSGRSVSSGIETFPAREVPSMAKIALNNLSLKELIELQSDVATAIVDRKAADKAALKQKMAELVAESGFTLDELVNGTKGKRGPKAGNGGTAPVKYRNPENPEETWSGRGRMATWLKDKIAKRGVKVEDFAV